MIRYNVFFGCATSIMTVLISCGCNDSKGTVANTLFEVVPTKVSGVAFENRLAPSESFNILEYNYYYNGGGVAAADFNGDGLTDLYFTGNQVSSKLYLNKGDLKFDDITDRSGVGTTYWATGVAVADVNNDGLQDIYVSFAGYKEGTRRANKLFMN